MSLSGALVQWRGLSIAGDRGEGHRVTMDTLDGWGDWEAQGDAIPRPLAHGSFDAPSYVPGRLVTIAGLVHGSDRDEVRLLLESELRPSEALEPLTVTIEGRTLTADVRVDRVSMPRTNWGSGMFRWAARFYAPDPLRYSAPTITTAPLPERVGGLEFPLFGRQGGAATGYLEWGPRGDTGRRVLSNPGTADSAPNARVTGPHPLGFSLTRVDTGQVVTYSGALALGEFVDVDFRRRRVYLGGTTDRTGLLSSRQWWTVPRGSDVEVAFTAPSYDTRASAEWSIRGAWW